MEELAGLSNPFRHTVVIDPWHPAQSDVPTIHARAFDVCRDALESVRSQSRSTSVLLHGEAGSGKTHLLARLRAHWAGANAAGSGAAEPKVVFVAVRLQTGPRRLWRYLRRSFAEDLLRPAAEGGTQLQQVLLHRFAEIRPASGDLLLWWQWLKTEHPADLEHVVEDLFERLDPDGQLGRDLCVVLGHVLLERHRRDARAWLLGDHLPESALRAMNLGGAGEDDDEQEDHARRTVVALCCLSGPKIPVVLCFDQVEALQVHPQDEGGLFAFGQLVMSLYQQTSNVLLISCIQSSFLERLTASVRGAAWDRMAAHQSSLEPLRWEDAVPLVTSRMAADPDLARLRVGHGDGLWPLDEGRLKKEVGSVGCSARKILATCAELFDAAARRSPTEPGSINQFLDQTWQERLERALAETPAEQADQILSHGLPLLAHCLGRTWASSEGTALRNVDLLSEGNTGRVGVALCNQPVKSRGLVDRLRRLCDTVESKQLARLVIIRDARLPIGAGAKKTQEYLEKLISLGARLVRPSAEAMAALQALRALLSDAKAGDLAHNGVPLEPKTVQEWLAAHLPSSLRELVDEVVSPSPAGAEQADESRMVDGLIELLDDRHIVPLTEAAGALGHPVAALEDCVRRHAELFGILNGAETVVFELTPERVDDVSGVET